MKRAVVAIYIDPDFFPPTINAVLNIAEKTEEVILVSLNNSVKDFPYPHNVKQIKIGRQVSVRGLEKLPVWQKVANFLKFTVTLFKVVGKLKTDLLLVYDPVALYSFHLVRKFVKPAKVWYHNHDMPNVNEMGRFSIGRRAAMVEKKAMKEIQYFSLPSRDRMKHYEGLKPSLTTFIIPNYPSVKVYPTRIRQKNNSIIRIIYQGFIGKGHALENLITLLKEDIEGYPLNLILKGSVSEEYRKLLAQIANANQVSDRVVWKGIGSYSEIPSLTSSCDIGIGFNNNTDPVSMAQATASNKIYEYGACGLAVILFDSPQYRKQLGGFQWALFTNGSVESLRTQLSLIIKKIEILREEAIKDFHEKLYFEKEFLPAFQKVMSQIK